MCVDLVLISRFSGDWMTRDGGGGGVEKSKQVRDRLVSLLAVLLWAVWLASS